MYTQFKNIRSWLYFAFMILFVGMSNYAIAAPDTGPSDNWLQAAYNQRIKEDNSTLIQFYGKKGTTKLHKVKKISCHNLAGQKVTQSCMVMVEITSYGLGRHKLNEQVVVRQTGQDHWEIISDVFN